MFDLEQFYEGGPFAQEESGGKWLGRDNAYFLKRIPPHSSHPDIDLIYQQMNEIEPRGYALARPIRNRGGEFVTRHEGSEWLLMPWIDHLSCVNERIPIFEILRALSSFHTDAAALSLPVRVERSYSSYLQRGLDIVTSRFPDHPFCGIYRSFIRTRLPHLRLAEGNIHFDLNPTNVWRDRNGEIVFADFDDAQKGPLLKDFCEIASEYLDLNSGDQNLLSSFSKDVEVRDLKHLVIRPRLVKIESEEELDRLIDFITNSVSSGDQ